jgi:TRAP-type uncharacterized transport system substrate-binding protein
MEHAFILNPRANSTHLRDALYEKMAQVKAMAACLLFASGHLDNSSLYDAIWAVTRHIDQIEQLQTHLKELP